MDKIELQICSRGKVKSPRTTEEEIKAIPKFFRESNKRTMMEIKNPNQIISNIFVPYDNNIYFPTFYFKLEL